MEAPADTIRRWAEHPAQQVRELFGATPDPWQDEVLEAFPHDPQIAMSCAKGPGKTAVLAWIGWNFISTRVDAHGVALSTSSDNLRDVLWAELAYWQSKSPFLRQYFRLEAERIISLERPKTWWLAARSYPRTANPQDQALVLQGVHGPHVLILIDEAGGVRRSVLGTAEAVLTGSGDQHIVIAGNPNNHDSALGQAVVDQRARWRVFEVSGDPDDPKRSPRISLTWAKNQIAGYGRDNPWVMVNVFGRFPPGGLNTLLSPDEVRDAQKRHYTEAQYGPFPRILGVDVGRFGDDESVIAKRQGKVAFAPLRMRNLDSLQGAAHVARVYNDWKGQSIQIDVTGGYGAGWYDQLQAMNYTPLAVQFAGQSTEPHRFYNKRAEIWWALAQWVKEGGALPPVPEMVAGLSTVTYSYRNGLVLLEDKEQVKARLGRSPDIEDAYACTFAYPVALPANALPGGLAALIDSSHQHDYDPYERYRKEHENG